MIKMYDVSFKAPSAKDSRNLDEIASKLTPFQRRFADVMAIGNVSSRAEAVRLAGSKAKRPSSVAHKLMQNESIREYIRYATVSRLEDITASAVNTMSELIVSADEDKVRFAAAKDTLDRLGLRTSERKHVHHTGGVREHIDLGD